MGVRERPLRKPRPPSNPVRGNIGVGNLIRPCQSGTLTRQSRRGIPLPMFLVGRSPRGQTGRTRVKLRREPGPGPNHGKPTHCSRRRNTRSSGLRTLRVQGADVCASSRWLRRPHLPTGSTRHPGRSRGQGVVRPRSPGAGSTRTPGGHPVEAASGRSRRGGPPQRGIPRRDRTKVIGNTSRGNSAKHRASVVVPAPIPPRIIIIFLTRAIRIVDPLLHNSRGILNMPPRDTVRVGGITPIWRLQIPLIESRGGSRPGRRRRGSSRSG